MREPLTPDLPLGKILNHELPEIPICKTFGCAKQLSRMEQLASDYCTECADNKKQKEIKNIFQ